MPRITVLPHPDLCPEGATIAATSGKSICDALIASGIQLEHACEKACVCTTCHVVIRDGFASLRNAGDDEEDQLGKAWGLELTSRLACQARVADRDLTIEIPRYSINFAREG